MRPYLMQHIFVLSHYAMNGKVVRGRHFWHDKRSRGMRTLVQRHTTCTLCTKSTYGYHTKPEPAVRAARCGGIWKFMLLYEI